MVAAQWRNSARRSLALLAMITVAVGGFTLLTAGAQTSRLVTTGTVAANFRPAYDLLVRAPDQQLPLERQRNLVQSGQLAGMTGGISLAQWRAIQGVDQVAVAAPVAVVGYVMRTVTIPVDLSGQLDPAAARQLLKVQPTWVTDAGLSRIPDGPAYLYATANPLRQPDLNRSYRFDELVGPQELDGSGRAVQICSSSGKFGIDPLAPEARSSLLCLGSDRRDWTGRPLSPTVTLGWTVPFLVAAVDPAQEAALAGLDRAVTAGRYFTAADGPAPRVLPEPGREPGTDYTALPFLLVDRPGTDATLELEVRRMPSDAADSIVRQPDSSKVRAGLAGRDGSVVQHRTIRLDDVYPTLVQRMRKPADGPPEVADTFSDDRFLTRFWSVGAPRLSADGTGLRAEPVRQDPKLWGTGSDFGDTAHGVPMEFADTGVRDPVSMHSNRPHRREADPDNGMPDLAIDVVGTFDPARVALGGELSAVPMDTYFNPGTPGADEASVRALRGGQLRPNANVTGLLGQPPLLLTPLSSVPLLISAEHYSTEPDYPEYQLREKAPISVVRVRLAGVVGLDARSRERVRVVAEQIAQRTGLQVDVTLGSSPTAVTVHDPPGRFGRPALALRQAWVQKGVAAVLVAAIDRKSVLLSGLVLAVCGLAVLNAAGAAVRARRTELAVLACLGWSRGRLLQLLVLEVAGIALAAGVLGTLLAVPAGLALGLRLGWGHALLALPAALLLAAPAAVWPAWRASRTDPAAAVRPAVRVPRRARPARTVGGLARSNLARNPGRTLLGAAGLAIGVAALTVLLAITVSFRGQVVGTLLGQAVALQARPVDYLAVAVTVLLGIACVADLLYLNITERAAELALLRAVGWSEARLDGLVLAEALGVGLLGGSVGAAAGLAGAWAFAGGSPWPLLGPALLAVAAGVLVAGVSAVLPLRLLHRLPTAQLLAQE